MDGSPAVFRKRELLRVTFDAVAPRADQMAQRFFERLFEERPEFHAYFQRTRLADLAPRIVQALGVIARSHDRPVALQRFVANLGARHAGYGVAADDYPAFIEQLVASLGEHAGAEWDEPAEQAWREALESVAQIMVEAAAAREDAGADAASPPTSVAGSSSPAATSATQDRQSSTGRSQTRQHGPADGSEEMAGFYQMIETAPVATLLVNSAGFVRYVNRSGQDLLSRLAGVAGLSGGQLINQPLQRLQRIAPAVVAAARGLQKPVTLEARIGQETVTVTLEPVFDVDGNPQGHCQHWVPVTKPDTHSQEADVATLQLLDRCADLIEQAQTLSGPASETDRPGAEREPVTRVEQLSRQAESARSSINEFAAALDELDRTGLVAANVEQQSNLLALNANIEVARGYDPSESVSSLAREAQELGSEAAELQGILTRQRESLREAADGLSGQLEAMQSSLEELQRQVEEGVTDHSASAHSPPAEWLSELRDSLQALRGTLESDSHDTSGAAA